MQLYVTHYNTNSVVAISNSQILVPFNQSKGDKADGKCQVWNLLFTSLFMFLLFQLQTHFISSQSIETCLSMML